MNNKLISSVMFLSGLLVAGACIFSAVRPVHASVKHIESNSDKVSAFISSIKPVTIEAEVTVESPKPIAKVTSKVSKKSSLKSIQAGFKGCYVHTLEQQGSPTAETVKVCVF